MFITWKQQLRSFISPSTQLFDAAAMRMTSCISYLRTVAHIFHLLPISNLRYIFKPEFKRNSLHIHTVFSIIILKTSLCNLYFSKCPLHFMPG